MGKNLNLRQISTLLSLGHFRLPDIWKYISVLSLRGSFPGVTSGRGVTLTPHHLLVPWSWKYRAIPLLPLWAVRPAQSLSACTRVQFTFTILESHRNAWYLRTGLIFCPEISVPNYGPAVRNITEEWKRRIRKLLAAFEFNTPHLTAVILQLETHLLRPRCRGYVTLRAASGKLRKHQK